MPLKYRALDRNGASVESYEKGYRVRQDGKVVDIGPEIDKVRLDFPIDVAEGVIHGGHVLRVRERKRCKYRCKTRVRCNND